MAPHQDLDPIQERYQYFRDQNIEEGHFDVTFEFGVTQDASGNYINDENKAIQQLHAHSFTLWPSSKVFEKTLFGPLAIKGPIPITRHSYKDFKQFLTYMYLGKCNINMNNVMALVDLGEYYQTKLLKKQCDEFLTKNSTKIENVLKVYESLKVYSLAGTMAKVMEFVAQNNAQILKTDEFLNVKKETIVDIVKMKNLKAKQEEVFEAICKWAEHNCPGDIENKQEYLKNLIGDVIPFINFSCMDFNFLNNFVVRKGFLFPSYDALADVLYEAAAKKQLAKEERLKIVPERRRIKLTNGNGYTAYADICDPAVIKSIETMIENKASSNFTSISNEIYECKASVPHDSPTAQFCLVRCNNGTLAIKNVNQFGTISNMVCCRQYSTGYGICHGCTKNKQNIQIEKIIAPVFVPMGSYFNLDSQCKIEFV